MNRVRFALVILMGAALIHARGTAAEGKAAAADPGPALAAAMKEAKVTLVAGLNSCETQGMPVSGKFELEGGTLQLSVHTVKAGKFSTVVIDPKSGKVLKTVPIADGDGLTAAQAQAQALGRGKGSLAKVVTRAETANPGYATISVLPTIDNGVAHAEIVLLKGMELKRADLRF